ETFGRVAQLTAALLGSARTSVWVLDDDGWLTPRTLHGYSAHEVAILENLRFEVSAAHRDLGAGLEPFVLGPADHARIGYGALEPDERALKRLELGALLHDIGKIGIPSDILSKPGRLTAEERAVIETHPALGERIIAPIDRLQEVRSIVRHCHERWDGRGYPDGISGEDIPLESRIVFVCDAYHAMTTDRPYRKRLSHPEAVRRLREGAGSQFDARVVEVCVSVLTDLRR